MKKPISSYSIFILWMLLISAELMMAQEHSLGLKEAVRIALENSEDIKDARLDLEIASEQVSESRSTLFPKIDASAAYSRNLAIASSFLPAVIFDPSADPSELIPVQFGSDNIWQSNINVEQNLFSPTMMGAMSAASRFLDIQRENVRGRAQSVVTRVRLIYYGLLLSQEQVRLVENSIARLDKSLKETSALREVGLATDYDVLRLEVELANLNPSLLQAKSSVMELKRDLGIELVIEESDGLIVSGSLAQITIDDVENNSAANREILEFSSWSLETGTVTENFLDTAQEARPDLRTLDQSEDLRRAELRIERARYLPEVVLFGSYGVTAQQNGSPDFFADPKLRAFSQQAGLRVTWPLFGGFSKDARIDQKQAALSQVRVQRRLARARAGAEIKTIWDQLQEARLRAHGQRKAVELAERGFEIVSAEYREGVMGQLELTDAEVALRQSEFNYAGAVYDFLVAQANLDLAVGKVPMVDSTSQSELLK
ncbi:MAG TPA: TolC family protein [Gemmatimonadetes bacterium]|jgi:outer membrane protein TolC|nr:TolC family protein [Gemmatimonadota bacterium]